jgi:hypothetical protein
VRLFARTHAQHVVDLLLRARGIARCLVVCIRNLALGALVGVAISGRRRMPVIRVVVVLPVISVLRSSCRARQLFTPLPAGRSCRGAPLAWPRARSGCGGSTGCCGSTPSLAATSTSEGGMRSTGEKRSGRLRRLPTHLAPSCVQRDVLPSLASSARICAALGGSGVGAGASCVGTGGTVPAPPVF